MLRRDESRHDFAFLAGVVVGAISGALTTLALTPMSGSETREKLREGARSLEPVKERAASVAATGKEKVTDLASRAPLPMGRHETGTGPSVEVEIERSGFGAHGGHPLEPAEGPRDASTRATPAAHEEIKGPADESSRP